MKLRLFILLLTELENIADMCLKADFVGIECNFKMIENGSRLGRKALNCLYLHNLYTLFKSNTTN